MSDERDENRMVRWYSAIPEVELITAVKERAHYYNGDNRHYPLKDAITELGKRKEELKNSVEAIEAIFLVYVHGYLTSPNSNSTDSIVDNRVIKQRALDTLSLLDHDIVSKTIKGELNDPEIRIRYAATKVIAELAKLGDEKALHTLNEIAEKESEESMVRGFAKKTVNSIKVYKK